MTTYSTFPYPRPSIGPIRIDLSAGGDRGRVRPDCKQGVRGSPWLGRSLGRGCPSTRGHFGGRDIDHALIGGPAVEPESCLDANLRIATAEGLILTKIVAFRPRDQIDIETLLATNRDNIDLELIRREWAAVAEGKDTRTTRLENVIERLVTPYH
jgi:hypothetical protein